MNAARSRAIRAARNNLECRTAASRQARAQLQERGREAQARRQAAVDEGRLHAAHYGPEGPRAVTA